MRQYILASHGRFAQGIYESVKIIIGAQENVHLINGYVEDGQDVAQEIAKTMQGIPKEDELIVCTDLFGGSINNEFMNYIGRKNYYLISGMNLPLLMSLFLYKEESPDTLIERVLKEVANSIIYCNKQKEVIGEDDF